MKRMVVAVIVLAFFGFQVSGCVENPAPATGTLMALEGRAEGLHHPCTSSFAGNDWATEEFLEGDFVLIAEPHPEFQSSVVCGKIRVISPSSGKISWVDVRKLKIVWP